MQKINAVKSAYIHEMLSQGAREYGRGFDEYRKMEMINNFIPHAEGSVRISIGNTVLLAAVKVDVDKPMQDKPEEGNISVSAELLPMASIEYEPGPPSPESVEFARVVDRGIRAASMIDTKALYIEPEKVWTVYIDLYALNYDGNLFDAGTTAAVAALHNTRMPKYEDGKVIREGEVKKLDILNTVTTCTYAKIDNKLLLDPSGDEERIMDCRITIGNDENCIRSIQKGLSGSFTEKEIDELVNRTFEKSKELRHAIKNLGD